MSGLMKPSSLKPSVKPRVKRHRLGLIALTLIFILGFLVVNYAQENKASENEIIDNYLHKLGEVYKIIKEQYVNEVSTETLYENAVKGMASRLDPYTQYLNPREYQELQEVTKGKFVGVGMKVTLEQGVFAVITPMEDTPAFRAGILAGDRILEINGESIEELSMPECLKRTRGKPGTQVTLTVLHKGENIPVKITITREIIKIQSVKAARIIDDKHKIGYLRITSFQEDTLKSFKDAAEELNKQGMRSLIIDLRFNGGGLMNEAIELANQFIANGVIVSTRGRKKEASIVFKADPRKAQLAELPLVVLINGGSASASEIFAGAIQDHGKALLIGTHTYGKALIQTPVLIEEDKSAVKLTVAKYYTPSGKCIQREKGKKNYGLAPDIEVEMTPEQEAELQKSWIQEEVIEPPEKTPPEKTPPEKTFVDIQLEKALEILKQE